MVTLVQNLPQGVDYELWQGDTWEPGTITARVSGTPINFTGYTATMEVRNAISNDVSITLTSTPAAGITLTSLGVITITMTAEQTNAMLGEYNYDLQVTDTSNEIRTYTYGTITVKNDATVNQ
jgi:hypothetical protein